MNYDGQQANPPVDGKTVYGGPDDDGPGKRYEIAISTRNLKWTNLAKYLELELGVQLPKDQKVRAIIMVSGCVSQSATADQSLVATWATPQTGVRGFLSC
jgi:hypothetical protein